LKILKKAGGGQFCLRFPLTFSCKLEEDGNCIWDMSLPLFGCFFWKVLFVRQKIKIVIKNEVFTKVEGCLE